jgi:hypothetical protein
MRRRRRWIVFGLLFLACSVALLMEALPGKAGYSIGPETTFLTEPLTADGSVDYVTPHNTRLRQGVTPEANANVLIWKALGPHPEGATMPPAYFHWLEASAPPDDGAYFQSLKSFLKRNGGEDEMPNLPWRAEHDPEVAAWLKINEKPLDIAREASLKLRFYHPLVPRETDGKSEGLRSALMSNVEGCKNMAAALCCRAMLRTAQGEQEEAWQDLLACRRLARLLFKGGSLLELMAGVHIELLANRQTVIFLDKGRLHKDQVRNCLHDLLKLSPIGEVPDNAYWAERLIRLDAICQAARYWQGDPSDIAEGYLRVKKRPLLDRLFTFNLNMDLALKTANRLHDRWDEARKITNRSKRIVAMEQIKGELNQTKTRISDWTYLSALFMNHQSRDEALAHALVNLVPPAYDKAQAAAEICEQNSRNVLVAFAVVAYQRDHDQYPATLLELLPKYLDKVPNDLFAQKPLGYFPEGDGFVINCESPPGQGKGSLLSIRIAMAK